MLEKLCVKKNVKPKVATGLDRATKQRICSNSTVEGSHNKVSVINSVYDLAK